MLRELIALGHDVAAFEPKGGWSLENLLKDHGEEGLEPWRSAYPELSSTLYDKRADLAATVDGADLVVVHEWNEPWLVAKLGRLRARGGRFTLLFHDTHHRAVSAPEEMKAYDLFAYDGELAFGEALTEVYRAGLGRSGHRLARSRRPTALPPAGGGRGAPGPGVDRHWGDGERTKELKEYLFRPARAAGLPLDVWGVRYHETAKATVRRYGGRYHGWLANVEAPAAVGSDLPSTCCGRVGTLPLEARRFGDVLSQPYGSVLKTTLPCRSAKAV